MAGLHTIHVDATLKLILLSDKLYPGNRIASRGATYSVVIFVENEIRHPGVCHGRKVESIHPGQHPFGVFHRDFAIVDSGMLAVE